MAFHFSRRKFIFKEEDHAGELNIVPYLDIMMNLIMFMLLSMTGLASFGVLNVAAPKYGPAAAAMAPDQQENKKQLMLTVLISDKGFFVAGTGGVLPGETAPTAPSAEGQPTIARLANGEYDYGALTAKMMAIKQAFPDESKIILGADSKVPYGILVKTMDACRENAGQMLFFDVSLAAGM
jgi:biopolymer transport protein TolR